MSVTTLPDLDQQTAEELQPPCDLAYAYMPGIGSVLVTVHAVPPGIPVVRCEHPAAWVLSTLCPDCSAAEVSLLCEKHATLPHQEWRCPKHGGPGPRVLVTLTPL